MKKFRILLAGCHGLLGQRIIQHMTSGVFMLGVDCHDTSYFHGDYFQYTHLDIINRRDVKRVIEDFKPDWIINAAAFTDVDACETKKEYCWKVNVEGVENLVKYASKYGAKFIHISSDYIFDGKKERYSENDGASPLNYYGRAKLASENIVKGSGVDWTILRTSTLYDVDALQGRHNFATWVIINIRQGNTIRVVTDQWGNPTLARNLAEAVWKVITLNKTEIFHVAGKDNVDRYTFAKRIASFFDLNEWLIEAVTTEELGQTAVRPRKIGLDVTKAENELGVHLMGIEEGLALFKQDYLEIHRIN